MKKLLLSFAFMQCSFVVTFCQESKSIKLPSEKKTLILEENSSNKSTLQERVAQIEGTFQIQTSKNDFMPLFTEDLVSAIENARKEGEDVNLQWGEFSIIYIPSKVKLGEENFSPLTPVKYMGTK